MSKKLVILTMMGCPYCKNLKKTLDELNIEYTDVDVDSNPKIWNQVVEQTQQQVLPMVYVTDGESNEGRIYIPGTDYEEEDEIIEIIKTEMWGE